MVRVADVPERSRYELRLDDRVIGFATYDRRNGRMALLHTEVADELSGRGLGSRLVREVLDDARRRGLAVVPVCPFVAHFIDEHPEYEALVAGEP